MRDGFMWPDAPVFVRESVVVPDLGWPEVNQISNTTAEETRRDDRHRPEQEQSHGKPKMETRTLAPKDGTAQRKAEPIEAPAMVSRQKSAATQTTEPIRLATQDPNQSGTVPPKAKPVKTLADLAQEQIAAARNRDLGNGHQRRGSDSPICWSDCTFRTSEESEIGTLCFNLLFATFLFSAVSAFVIYDIKSLFGWGL